MTPDEGHEMLTTLRRAQNYCKHLLKEWPDHWRAAPDTIRDLETSGVGHPYPDDFIKQSLWGLPMRPAPEIPDGEWMLVSRAGPIFRGRLVTAILADGKAAPFVEGFGSLATGLPKDPPANLSQIAADLKKLTPAAAEPMLPGHAKPKPFLTLTLDSFAAAKSVEEAFAKLAAGLKQAEPAMPMAPMSLHGEFGLKLPDPPLYPPDPELAVQAAAAVRLAAEQIATALEAGQLPVSAQAHHATVGQLTAHLAVDIAKEHPWTP